MSLLHLHQFAEGENRYRVLAEFENGAVRRSAESRFELQVSAQDQEDIRWYLEDFLQYPMDPAPAIAARIERRMAEIGMELFTKALGSTSVWQEARHDLSATRVEIETTVKDATALPWELMRDPEADMPLALRARTFVRATHDSVQRPKLVQSAGGPIRVLLVICRPRGREDVPFRSVARRMLEGLRGSDAVRLTVLRPPTFERLAHVLREAHDSGEPYHLVHFDGHGVWSSHGYLEFENSIFEGNRQLVGGQALGNLLAETGVAALVLNACQSAYAEPPSAPVTVAPDNPHQETRAYGSLAQEVMDAGTAGVVAMRYSVFVDTAAQFIAKLYERLTQGDALGEAASFARKQLHAQPLRRIAFDPRPLQDWMVPVVFEAEPVALFPRRKGGKGFSLSSGASAQLEGLPPRPDAGFIGRDETLLALDRAFDDHAIVLLHAYAGSGKTSAAAEFARWYRETRGVDGPVLFTSFEHYRPLLSVLNDLAGALDVAQDWFSLDETKRRSAALQLLRQRSVLWIWDNVEPVAGFPKGSESKWGAQEQRELADFLRAARETRAKFLLTSRRDERDWLGDLPARVTVPPMPFQERLELARALASKHGRRLTDVEDWRPLLEFTQGNPLAITVIVGQALRDGLRTREQVEAFVARLRAGEAVFKDEATQGRTRSLAASLNHGFEHAFNEKERNQLALLHLFQGFVQVAAIGNMVGISLEVGIRLLDRAAEVGLLTAHGGGGYSIHPAVPWFFHVLFERQDTEARVHALRAYVEVITSLGSFYHNAHGDGRDAIGALSAEEPNLLHARALAIRHGWWPRVTGAMQGLRTLYRHTGRRAEWARMVEEIVPYFVDPATDGPLAGREENWSLVTEYRVRLQVDARRWSDAERLQKVCVEWDRRRAREGELNSVRTLAVALQGLGDVQRAMGSPETVRASRESFDLGLRIADRSIAASAAFNLGRAYEDMPAIRNLEEAERWYAKSLELHPDGDHMSQAGSLGQLGSVSYQRFKDARAANKPEPELLRHLNQALRRYRKALEMTPIDAVDQLAAIHNQLGGICCAAADFDNALHHCQEAARLQEEQGNLYGAAITRYNVAVTLKDAGRFADARQYAQAALRDFQAYGPSAADEVQKTLSLISLLAKAATA
ncbi:MAG TPA: CHAT domain-containing protein [Bryobacteraceae bacterium]|nr:CHAT domain-containing protein [Bryobacteraceae bacterium]